MTIRTDITINWSLSPRIITVASPSTELTAQDLYDTCMDLEAKSDAVDNKHIIDAAGKESLGGGTSVGLTVTLLDAKVAFEARPGPTFVQCSVGGGNVVAVDTAGDPTSAIEPTSYTQVLLTSSSSATLQDLESVQASSFLGGVAIKATSGNIGTAFPAGTREQPCSTFDDAHVIAENRGLNKFYLMEDFTLGNFDVSDENHIFIGDSQHVVLTVDPLAIFTNSSVENLTIQGELDGLNKVMYCNVNAVTNLSGLIKESNFSSTITLSGETEIYDCFSNSPGMGSPTVSVGNNILMLRNFHGSMAFTDILSGIHTVEIYGGRAIFDASCTGGTVYVRGDMTAPIEDNSNGTVIVDQRTGKDESDKLNDVHGQASRSVFIDTESLVIGNGYQQTPYNNFSDAVDYMEANGLKNMVLLADATVDRQLKNFIITGVGTPTIDFNSQNMDGSEISRCTVTGLYTGQVIIQESNFTGTVNINGFIENCAISSTLVVPDGGTAYIKDCSAFVVGTTIPIFDVGGVSGTGNLVVAGYDGGLNLINVNQPTDDVKLVMNVSRVVIDSSCTSGTINVGGITRLTDNSTGSTVTNIALDPKKILTFPQFMGLK